MNLISLIFSKISGTTWMVLGVIAGGFAAFFRGYTRGLEEERQKQLEKEHDQLQKRLEIAEDVNALSDGDVDSQLREYIKKRGD